MFFALTGDEMLNKSADQLRRWRAPRLKSSRNFIAIVGDKSLDEITRDDLLDFREWLVAQMRAGKFGSNNATKDLLNVGRIFKTVNERKRLSLSLTLDFRDLSIKAGDEGTRPPFSDGWIRERLLAPEAQMPRAQAAVALSGAGDVRIGLMHDAKGQEYRAVAVMACDGDVLPNEERLQSASDERAYREIYDTERHLLYVAATRGARAAMAVRLRARVRVP